MTPAEAKALGCAYFNNQYGVRRICHTGMNPYLWPGTHVNNEATTTCADCIDMLAKRVEVRLVRMVPYV